PDYDVLDDFGPLPDGAELLDDEELDLVDDLDGSPAGDDHTWHKDGDASDRARSTGEAVR
ncbi:MAG: hypothetical protein L0I24_24585, partial [Pseudonocardia sp.]|nr:hypothetical protein [Pseudonocardia sp.]